MGLLNGKVAIVTGAASKRGIGRAIAQTFAQAGASVAVTDVDGQGASEAAEELRTLSGKPTHRSYPCDVTRREQIEQIVESVNNELGIPSILVNNAGITQPRKLGEISDSDYDAVLDVNLRGSLLASQTVLPYMRELGEGSVIFISSVSAERGGGIFGGPHYSAAKSGILGLMRAMARDLAPEGIRANAVAPGFIDTDITAGKLSDETLADIVASIPLGRVGMPEDVANCCLFLASRMSSYMTGEVLDVNGGMHID